MTKKLPAHEQASLPVHPVELARLERWSAETGIELRLLHREILFRFGWIKRLADLGYEFTPGELREITKLEA